MAKFSQNKQMNGLLKPDLNMIMKSQMLAKVSGRKPQMANFQRFSQNNVLEWTFFEWENNFIFILLMN